MEARAAVHAVTALFFVGAWGCNPAVSARPDAVAATRATPTVSGEPGQAPRQAPRADSSCSAEEGPAPDCATLPNAACLGATLTRRACETVGPLLRPSAAGRWLACVRERADPESVCDSGRIVACGLRAAEAACVDGSFRELCSSLSADCADIAPEITAPVCERLLGAFRPEHQSKLIDCLRQGCGTGGFGICLP